MAIIRSRNAGVAQLVERNVANVEVASSRLVSRSLDHRGASSSSNRGSTRVLANAVVYATFVVSNGSSFRIETDPAMRLAEETPVLRQPGWLGRVSLAQLRIRRDTDW